MEAADLSANVVVVVIVFALPRFFAPSRFGDVSVLCVDIVCCYVDVERVVARLSCGEFLCARHCSLVTSGGTATGD